MQNLQYGEIIWAVALSLALIGARALGSISFTYFTVVTPAILPGYSRDRG